MITFEFIFYASFSQVYLIPVSLPPNEFFSSSCGATSAGQVSSLSRLLIYLILQPYASRYVAVVMFGW